jgi:drug/metabolite transporter (DMT)-like permease
MPGSNRFPLYPFIILLIGGSSLGFTGIFMRMSELNPVASAFWRFALAAPVLWMWAVYEAKKDKTAGKWLDLHKVLILAGLYFAGDMALLHLSFHYTTVANASLMLNMAPVVIAFIMWKIHHTRFAPIFIIGMVVALVGAVGLLGASFSHGGKGLWGDFLGLLAAGFYAGYQLLIKAARVHYSCARLMAWSTTVTACGLLPLALLMPGPFWPTDLHALVPLLGLAVVAQLLGQTPIAWASGHLSTALSSVILLVMPLVGAIAAWILFNERLSPIQIGGGLVLLVGLYMTTRGYYHHNPPP